MRIPKKIFVQFGSVVVVLIIVVFVIFSLFLEIDQVADSSMAPAYVKGQFIVLQKMNKRLSVGDVVIFRNQTNSFGIERIIGVPGDTYETTATTVLVRGKLFDFSPLWDIPANKGVVQSINYLVLDDTHSSPVQTVPASAIIGSVIYPRH